MAGRLKGKSCIITGAGSGMGKAMAELFAAEGARLVLADVSGNQDAVAAALGNGALPVHCDVSSEEQVKALVRAAEDSFGRIDVLCNNAGISGPMAPLHEQTAEEWQRIHDVNLKGVFFGMKYGIASMLKTGGGAVVNTTSASAVVGWKHHSVYAAAKAGVNQLTRVAALDYARDNIRVNAVVPGTIWTGLVEQSKTMPEPPERGFCLPGIPMDRWGLAREIAAAALFLASDESSYTTGALLPVDGGYCIGFSGMGAEQTGEESSAIKRSGG